MEPRLKSYSADTGYVYLYFFEGHRGGAYLFQVSADRRSYRAVSVRLEEAAVAAFERAHERVLNATERYAVVKLALFRAFDEHPGPGAPPGPVAVGVAEIERAAEALGFL